MSRSSGPRGADRRSFLKSMGAASVGSVVLASVWAAAEAAGAGKSAKPRPKRAATPPATPAPVDSSKVEPADRGDDVKALVEVVRVRYGAHLTAEQLEAVAKEIEQRVAGGRALRDAKLRNSDEPDVTFSA